MSHGASPLAAFHVTGDRSRLPQSISGESRPLPALFGAYHDLARLRTDFPLILSSTPATGPWVVSLVDAVDAALRATTQPGTRDEAVRRQSLALEQSIRIRFAEGERGTLARLWELAREELIEAASGAEIEAVVPVSGTTLEQVREALDADGELVDCDENLASKLVRRAWREAERQRAEQLHARIERLIRRLSDINQADFRHSPEARSVEYLQRSFASADHNVLDFEAMSQILRTAPTAPPLPEQRKQRIKAAIDTLREQRFVAPTGVGTATEIEPYVFDFDNCMAALSAFEARLPEMSALVRAIAIAELEIENRYDETRHDGYFENFDSNRLGPADIDLFPAYLVTVAADEQQARNDVLALLQTGLPFKILAQCTDPVGDIGLSAGQLAFGRRGQNLARMALGLGNVSVLQAPQALLYRLRDAVLQTVTRAGAALFSIYAGPDYLTSAAACESRVFPCLVYDPANGSGQARRYSLAGNPQIERDWPTHSLEYESAEHSRQKTELAFTLADFLAADARFADFFAGVTEAAAGDGHENILVPIDAYLQLESRARARAIPCVTVIDENRYLYRAIVNEKVVDASIRCLDAWRDLQELGGIGNSHVAASLAAARAQREAEGGQPAQQPILTLESNAAPGTEASTTEPAQAVHVESAPADAPWIETVRCTTCNECTQINDRMFAYNEDMRAYIADPDAGTYRELVEAAETCQVAIIHPGKPRNTDEPGLEELVERARPFQ